MPRKIAYWGATGLVAIVTLLAGFSYLITAPEAVENFRHVGYPQQLRVLLGIGKLAGAIVLLLPRLPTLKEWAYAGFTFMWIAAVGGALSGGRRQDLAAGRVDRVAGGFVRHAPGESPRFREGAAGVATLDPGPQVDDLPGSPRHFENALAAKPQRLRSSGDSSDTSPRLTVAAGCRFRPT